MYGASTRRLLVLERSDWFNRGWTLQELLAPIDVHFFDASGDLRGSKPGHRLPPPGVPNRGLQHRISGIYSYPQPFSDDKGHKG
jgi:hypothetical protein